jgi:hypothetical protein
VSLSVTELRRDILDSATETSSTNGAWISTEGITDFVIVADLSNASAGVLVQESNDQSEVLYDWQLAEDSSALGHWRAEGRPACAFIRVAVTITSGSVTYSLRDVS